MKKSLALFATVLAAVLNAATPSTSLVYVDTTARTLTGNIVAGNNTTISASGNGTITATASPLSGLTGLGSGVGTFLATPSSANLASAVTNETGSGALVFATSPTLVTPVLGAATGTSLSLSGSLAVSGAVDLQNLTAGTFGSALPASASVHVGWLGDAAPLNPAGVNGSAVLASRNTPGAEVVLATQDTVRVRVGSSGTTLAGALTVGGNLTVSGAGTSTFAGNVAVTGTGTNYTAIDTGSFVKFGNNQTSSNLQVGAQGFGGVIQGAQSGSAAYNILAQPYGGNFLIGTTTDTGGRLVVDKASQAADSNTSSSAITVANLAGGNAVLDIGVSSTYLGYLQTRNYTTASYYQLNLQPAGGNVLIGKTDDSGSGKLQLASSTANSGGLGFGSDVSLYRAAAGTLSLMDYTSAATGVGGVLNLQGFTSGTSGLNNFAIIKGTKASGTVGGVFTVQTSDTSGNPQTALTLDSSQNATFAGTTKITNGNLQVYGYNGNSALAAIFLNADQSSYIYNDNTHVNFRAGGVDGLKLASGTGNATFVGNIKLSAYGAGTLTTDSSGNVTATSDERAKNITGTFTKGLAEVVKLTPKTYTWKEETGLNTTDEVASLTAQDLIAAGIPEAVSTYRTVADLNDDGTPKLDADGKPLTKRIDATYTVSDRAVIAALVNAVKELKAEVDALKAARN